MSIAETLWSLCEHFRSGGTQKFRHNGRMYRFLLLFALVAIAPACAQTDAGKVAGAGAGEIGSQSIAPETETLPSDRAEAWEMLRAASGLGGNTLKPWYLRAHYKTYDAYGKPKNDGTLEYVWFGPNAWHFTFTEGARIFARWKTEEGLYSLKNQPPSLSYPANLVLPQFIHPLGDSEAGGVEPASFAKEKVGSVTLSCFSFEKRLLPELRIGSDFERACTAESRPLLLLRQGEYNVFFQHPLSFQHRVVAKTTLVKFGSDAVVDINLDLLRTVMDEDLKTLKPPPEAELQPESPKTEPASVLAGRLIRKTAPDYPLSAKRQRLQGTVKLAAVIGTDGRIKNLEVMQSPNINLTHAAEDAVKHWVYKPFLLGSQPIEVSTAIYVTFVLGG